MNFELNDVASSSSSSSSQSDDDGETNGSSSSDHEVDETLAYEVRSALHLAVGKICREEDNAEKSSSTAENSTNNNSPTFAMSKDAIVALTDLTYHYSTTLLSNDLVTFSKHAKRQTVKTDDVLLMARKDKKGMLSELKRIMSDNPDLYTERSKKKTKGLSAAVQKRKKVVNQINKRASAATAKSKDKSKGSEKGGGKKKGSILSSSDDDDSSDESIDNAIFKERRKKLDLERSKQRKSCSHRSRGGNARQDDDGSDGERSLNANEDSFDNNDNSGSSEEEVEFHFGMMTSNKKKKGGVEKKNEKKKKKSKQKKSDSSVDLSESDDGNSEDMVIDLAGD